MYVKTHLKETLKLNPAPSPWPKMVICMIATVLPLIVGYGTHQLGLSVFGALTGFLLVLNDHMGTLKHRLFVISMTFIFLVAGFRLGVFTHAFPYMPIPLIVLFTFTLGLMGGVGAELERGFLFFILQLLSGVYSSSHMNQYALQVLGYSFLAYASIVVVLVLSVVLKWHLPKPFVGIRSVLKNTITHRKNYYIYAVYYALTALLALLFSNALKIDHGYWVVSTVLLVMRPDVKLSVYRNIQRFFGTLTGFFIAEIFISQIHTPEVLIGVLALFSFLGPWALSKNYGLGTFVVVIMILLIIDLPLVQIGDLHTPLIRLHSTMLGCGFGLAGSLLAHAHNKFLVRE